MQAHSDNYTPLWFAKYAASAKYVYVHTNNIYVKVDRGPGSSPWSMGQYRFPLRCMMYLMQKGNNSRNTHTNCAEQPQNGNQHVR